MSNLVINVLKLKHFFVSNQFDYNSCRCKLCWLFAKWIN